MRKGFLGSLTALLAATSLALAQQPPATSDPAPAAAPNGAAQQAPAVLPRDVGTPFIEGPRSPYWPDPFGKAQCAAPGCALPPVPAEEKHHDGQFVIWGSADYLLWWVKNQPLGVPLVTTGNSMVMKPGALDSLGTAVLFGGSDIDYHTFSGGRFTLGLGFGSDYNGILGVEGSGFFLEKRPANFFAASSVTGVPVIARPFVNAQDKTESVLLVSDPGRDAGSVSSVSYSTLYGWDVDLVGSGYRDSSLRVDLLGGFRYLNLSEDFDISQQSTLVPNGSAGFAGNILVPPTNVAILDHFGTRNEFYGGQLGARVEYGERLFISASGKIALGSTHEVINLEGFTKRSGPGTTTVITPGGLLVLSSNAGWRAHDEFAVIPEIGINVGYNICRGVKVYVGYTFLYWSDVVRPGDQINRVVNPTLVPASQTYAKGPAAPAEPSFTFQRTDFWAQGVNFGLALRW